MKIKSHKPSRIASGISTVEVLCTLAILAILTTFGSVMFGWFNQQIIIQQANTLFMDMQYALNTAQRFRHNVTICISDNQKNCANNGDLLDWSRGWIVFHDPKKLFQPQQNKDILRVYQTSHSSIAIRSNRNSGISFSGRHLFSSGKGGLPNSTIEICMPHKLPYRVVIDSQGYSRLIKPDTKDPTCPAQP